MIEHYNLSGNGDDEQDKKREDIRKDIDESTTHERPEPDTDPPTNREEK